MKKTKRSKTKYPGLVKSVNTKNRQHLIDEDYIKKLSEEQKDWLNRFNEEYNNANFNHPGDKLHKTKEEELECYNRDYARKMDVLVMGRVNNKLDPLHNHDGTDIKTIRQIEKNRPTNLNVTEDVLITLVDLKIQES